MLKELSVTLPDNLPLILSAGLGLIFLLLTLYLSVRQASLKARLHASERLSLERQNLLQQLRLEVQRLRERELKFSRANAALFERREVLEQKSAELNAEKERLLESLTALREENTRLKERNADFRSKIDALDQLRDEDHERFRISSQELESRLVSLGERMLKERGEALSKLSSSQFQEAVRPLKAELEVFRGFLHKSEQQSAQQAGALQQELNNLQKAQLKLSAQADSLSQALQSGGKSQGMWGELQLERVLESSGLQKGVEYEREVAARSPTGELGRPDAIVRLPDGHCLIIDAKCSLTAYTGYVNANSEDERSACLKAHVSSLKNHIAELKRRDYSGFAAFNAPSFVFMFVPLDAALTEALRSNSSLYDEAGAANVYLVSPSTLIPALRVVSNLWLLSSQNERMRSLAQEAQQIYTEFNLVLEAYTELCQRQEQSGRALNLLGQRLTHGRGNLKKRLENFAQKAPAVIEQPAEQNQA